MEEYRIQHFDIVIDMTLRAICYFGDFEKNDQSQWTWKWNGDNGESVAALHVSTNTSYTELYHDIGNLLIFYSSEYDMEFGFLFPSNTHFSVLPIKITSDMQLKWRNWTHLTEL
ncbi:Uncharacterized protein Adt_15104 [Abeliophyllum distichum]|uniref:Uncharacterized protein n=1 Tax=Abeliophyllum distichum TaxID=126358 RepID=A0ABD1U1J6_9LAMI